MKVSTTVFTQPGRKKPFLFVDIDGETWQFLPGGRKWQVKCPECKKFVSPELLHAACTPTGHG